MRRGLGSGTPPPLAARPGPLHQGGAAAGLHRIALPQAQAGARPALLQVPAEAAAPMPLAVMLHGSGGDPQQGLALLHPWAQDAGAMVLAPASRDPTWDAILGAPGPDWAAIDALLAWVFARYPVDPARLAVGGFSDGASCALGLALANGDLFTHAIAFAPGFVADGAAQGRPALFVAHGSADRVLPVAPCSRRIVPALRQEGYAVDYREFDGGHEVPPQVASAAVRWWLQHPAA